MQIYVLACEYSLSLASQCGLGFYADLRPVEPGGPYSCLMLLCDIVVLSGHAHVLAAPSEIRHNRRICCAEIDKKK